MSKTKTLVVKVLLGLTCVISLQSKAVSPDSLVECGVGTLKAYRFISVGSAKLFRSSCDEGRDTDKSNRWLIQFKYEVSVPKRAFVESSEEILSRNNVVVSPEIHAFNAYYQDIEEGDIYQLDLTQNVLTLSLNGNALGQLQGDDAWRYLAIWFGDVPFDKRLKRDLLGR